MRNLIVKSRRKFLGIFALIGMVTLIMLPIRVSAEKEQTSDKSTGVETSENVEESLTKTRKGVIADWFYMPFEQAVENASIIIHGKVLERGETKEYNIYDSKGEVATQDYYTEITVEVIEAVKGAIAKKTIIYKEPGGETEDVICVYDGLEPLEVGAEYIFFLNEHCAFLNPLTVIPVSEGKVSLKTHMIPESFAENEEFQATSKVDVDEYIKAIKLEMNYYVKCVAVALVVVGGVITVGFYMVWVKKHGRKNQAEV